MSSEGTPLHGDRGAWNTMSFDTEHAKDIADSTLRRHLPLPGAAGGIAQSDGTDWQRVSSLALADIAGYARGYIIRGGASDWEAYDASTSGFILVGDGTDIASVCFDWDTMAGGASADMVHTHTSNAEGGQISHDSALADISADDHHSETHVINSTGPHAEASLTIGHFLRATGAAAFSFAAVAAGDLPAAIDAAKIADGSVSNVEFQYLDDYAAIGLVDLTAGEVNQLENIAATTISAAQWAYLGLTNQGLATTDSPTFNALTATSIIIGGNTITTTEWANLDGLNQTLATTSSPTFAALTISASGSITMPDAGWLGIAGNELLTVNAAGNFTFSGVTSVIVPDGCWIGADAACSWLFDSTNGDVTTMDVVGIGTTAPGIGGAAVSLHIHSAAATAEAAVKAAATAQYARWIAENDTAGHNLSVIAWGTTIAGNSLGVARADKGMFYTNNMPIAIGTADNFDLTLSTNNIVRVFVKNTGAVGVGVTPSSAFEIYGDAAILTITDSDTTITAVGEEICSINFKSMDASILGSGGFAGRIVSVSEQVAGAYAGLAFYTHRQGAGNLREVARISSLGYLGIKRSSPQGLLHGYDTISGFMHWEYDGVDSTARTVHTNVAGDVVYQVHVFAVARASDGNVAPGAGGSLDFAVEPGNAYAIYSDGGAVNVLTFAVAADGSMTVQRTAGALTYKVGLWLLWL